MSEHPDKTGAARITEPPPGQMETLEGTVERIIYRNSDNFYTVAVLKAGERGTEYTIVGNLAAVQPQEVLRVEGQFFHDKNHGRQFRVENYTPTLPANAAAIEKYLGSGLIKGIGKVYAKRLVEKFGDEIFGIIEESPERLREVEGIGKKRFDTIRRGWDEHRAVREIIMFLQRYNIPQSFAARIYRQYGDKAIEQIQKNPYQLALDVRGIGFKSADAIAQKIGIPLESIERCKAGVYYLLQDFAGAGHVYFPADPLIQRATESLGVLPELIVAAINALKADKHVVLEVLPDGAKTVYLRNLHAHETAVAELILRIQDTGKLFPKLEAQKEIAGFEERFKFTLAPAQREAIADALRGGVLVITGGPGTGKTTIIRAILHVLTRHGVTALLAAPTGRAAKRMQELTHQPASTIHRLLQFSPQEGKYQRNAQNPLRTDFVIVDESSMVDVALSHALLRAVAPTSSIIFVGDVDQLPSVGPGNFLRDLIDSGAVAVVRLNEVFRQAQQSLIVTNAHRINTGQRPMLKPPDEAAKADFCYFEAETPEKALDTIKQLVRTRIPTKFGFSAREDIQVLSPMHRGVIGAQNLNREIQDLLNPGGAAVEIGGRLYRVGDKVMQTANNYDKDVFNGDIGYVVTIDREDHLLKVNFDGHIVPYEFNELDELELAYAITIHKSQGSEYKAVVLPIHTTHFVMLHRNLLYTGITRGRKLVCLVGQRKAIDMAVGNVSSAPRYSALDQRLAAVRKARPSPQAL